MRRTWLAGCLGFALSAAVAAAAEGPAAKISQFSGKPVPRFETLRYSAVNGRAGPSRDHPILWRYEREGLPVLIIKESRDWRRVRDPDGDEVWMHSRMLRAAPRAVVRHDALMRAKASETAPDVARLRSGVLATVKRCEAVWCEIEAGGRAGWLLRTHLWGVEESEAPL